MKKYEFLLPKNSYVVTFCQGLGRRGWKATAYLFVQIKLHK